MKKIKRHSVFQSERITFLRGVEDLNEYGELIEKFEDVETLWCCTMPLKAEEKLYYVFFQGKTAEWLLNIKAIKWENKIFTIISSKQWNARNGAWIDMVVKEKEAS
jgi:hypothetical protein